MSEGRYDSAVAETFRRLVKGCDAADPDRLEADATSSMVTITGLTTGQKVIVNTQRALFQIWVAGRGEGVHFSLGDDGAWRDDRGKGIELFAWVSSCVEAATGEQLAF